MTSTTPISSLRRFAGARRAAPKREVCELCGSPVGASHRHLFHRIERRPVCACDACALLFPGHPGSKYALIPRDARKLQDFAMSDAEWDCLGIPIGLAFFSRRSDDGRVRATYPSPAGAVESELEIESWDDLTAQNPILKSLEPDVETLLVNRTRHARDYYLAPIDRCYELAGTVRRRWRGLSGGAAVWEEIDQFFARLNRNGYA